MLIGFLRTVRRLGGRLFAFGLLAPIAFGLLLPALHARGWMSANEAGLLLALLLAARLYASFLQWPPIRRAYPPDYTWVTVIGGNALIGFFQIPLLLTLAAVPTWRDAIVLLVLPHFVAGGPIVEWQVWELIGRRQERRQERERRKQAKAATLVEMVLIDDGG